MIVCVCHRVSDREIARHARAGMCFDEIQFELGVATQCGQCEGCARDVVASAAAAIRSPPCTRRSAVRRTPPITGSRAWPNSPSPAA